MSLKTEKSVSSKRNNRKLLEQIKKENEQAKQKILYARFPFDDDMELFEEEEFNDIHIIKTFIEECEVDMACVVNGAGSTVTTFVDGVWLHYA